MKRMTTMIGGQQQQQHHIEAMPSVGTTTTSYQIAMPGHAGDGKRGITCGRWREGEDVLLAMVLIENMMTLLLIMLIKCLPATSPPPDTNKDNKSTKPTTRTLQQLQPECEPTNAMTTAMSITNGILKNTAMPGRPSLYHWSPGI